MFHKYMNNYEIGEFVLELLGLANLSGALEKLLQKFETGPSKSSKSSTERNVPRNMLLIPLPLIGCVLVRRS